MMAAAGGYAAVVPLLLSHKANVNMADKVSPHHRQHQNTCNGCYSMHYDMLIVGDKNWRFFMPRNLILYCNIVTGQLITNY